MLAEFRARYPQGSLLSELIDIDRGLYLVKVAVQVEGITLANGLAAAEKLELAEDRARERAISALGLEIEPKQIQKIEEPVLATVTPSERAIENGTKAIIDAEERDNNSSVDQVVLPRTPHPAIEQMATSSEPATPTINAPLSVPKQQDALPDLNVASEQEQEQGIDDTPDTNQGTLFAGTYNSQSTEVESVLDLPNPTATISSESDTTTEIVEMDFNKIKHQTDIEIKRLGWTRDDGRNFLQSHYGKRSRLHLTDEELLEFLHYLESLPTPVNS